MREPKYPSKKCSEDPESCPADVSVIVPCYRCADTVERAVHSVYTQTWRPAEVILVDDCSGDGTLELLHALQSRYPEGWIKVIEQPKNMGPGSARNAAWDATCHKYVAFLDADDTWHPRKIEIQYQWMRSQPDVALTGHAVYQLKHSEEPGLESNINPLVANFCRVTKNRLLWSNRFSTPSVMLRRDLQMRFASGKYHSEDYLLWLTIACAGKRMAYCNLPLAFIYKAPYGESGLSSQLWMMEKGELDTYRRVRQAGYLSLPHYTFLRTWSLARFLRRLVVRGT